MAKWVQFRALRRAEVPMSEVEKLPLFDEPGEESTSVLSRRACLRRGVKPSNKNVCPFGRTPFSGVV